MNTMVVQQMAWIISRGFYNAKANEQTYGSRESGVRYSKEDILDKFGIEERKLSDYIYVQKRVFDTLKSEGFFTEFDNSNNRYYRIDKNIETGIEVETNKSGINETFNYLNYASKGKKLKIDKLATIRLVPDIIKHGKVVSDNISNDHKKNPKFSYIEHKTTLNEKNVTLKIAIKKSAQKNKFWVHYIYIENDTGNYSGKTNLVPDNTIPGADSKTIPQSTPKSNSKSEIQGPKSKDDTIYLSAVERGDI